jgi:CheY-like chemotaxis protein
MTPPAGPLVLGVDDYQDAREMYSQYLQASGFRVAEARTGTEAVRVARELKPDCILMDLALPGIDGWEATRQIKADGSSPSPATAPSSPRATRGPPDAPRSSSNRRCPTPSFRKSARRSDQRKSRSAFSYQPSASSFGVHPSCAES